MQNLAINLILVSMKAKPAVLYFYSMWFLKIHLPFLRRGVTTAPQTERGRSGKKIGFLFHNRFYLFDNLTPIQVGCIYWTRHLKRTLNTRSSFVRFLMFQVFVNIHKLGLQSTGDGAYGFCLLWRNPKQTITRYEKRFSGA